MIRILQLLKVRRFAVKRRFRISICTGQEAVAVLCGWEGNRRSRVTQTVIYAPAGSVASERAMTRTSAPSVLLWVGVCCS